MKTMNPPTSAEIIKDARRLTLVTLLTSAVITGALAGCGTGHDVNGVASAIPEDAVASPGAAVAISTPVSMPNHAQDFAVISNMHEFQLAAEEYRAQHGQYAAGAAQVAALLPNGGANFKNPFTNKTGSGRAWEDRGSFVDNPTSTAGLISYADTSSSAYNIKACDEHGNMLSLVLTSHHWFQNRRGIARFWPILWPPH